MCTRTEDLRFRRNCRGIGYLIGEYSEEDTASVTSLLGWK